MVFALLAFLIIVCFCTHGYMKKKYRYFEDLGIPFIPPVPLLGNMARTVLRLQHNHETVKDFYNYKPEAKYIGIFNFMRPVIVVRDPEIIKNITVKHFDNFTDRRTLVYPDLDPLFGKVIFLLKGDEWREQRKFFTPAFTPKKMKTMFEPMLRVTRNLMRHVDTLVKENPQNMVSTKDLFSKYTNDVVACWAFGLSIDSFEEPNNEFYLTVKKYVSSDGLVGLKFLMARLVPNILKFFKIKLFPDHVARFFENSVRESIRGRVEKNITRPDLIQLMMGAPDSEGVTNLDIAKITSQAFTFLLGGFDTSKTQMCIIAHELMLNQDIQKCLQDEIDAVMEKTNGEPSYQDITTMPYLDAVFSESMRRHPQADILDRECLKAYELPPTLPGAKPVTVKPGMNFWIPIVGVHNDERFFDNPTKFDPERYMNRKITNNTDTNLGFGVGPRSCIGARFAILETKILFVHLLSKFDLKPTSKTRNFSVYDVKNFSISPCGGYWLTFKPRR